MVSLSDVGSGPFNSFLFKCMKQSNIFFSSQGIIIFKEFVYRLQAVWLVLTETKQCMQLHF